MALGVAQPFPHEAWHGQSLIIVLVIILGVVYIFKQDWHASLLAQIPGPRSAPYCRIWQIQSVLKNAFPRRLNLWHERHGYFIRIAPREISVSHPDAIKKLLHASLIKGDAYRIHVVPDWRYATAMSVLNPKDKIELSKNLNIGLTHSNLLQVEANMNQCIIKLLHWMDQYAERQQAMSLDEFLTFTVLDSVGEILFSKPYGFLDAGKDVGNAVAMVKYHSKYLAIMAHYRWFHWLLANPVVAWLQIIPMGHLYDRTMAIIRERQANPDVRFDVMAHWLRALERAELRRLEAAAAATVGAGADTVACTLQAFIYHMRREPMLWARGRDEIREAQGAGRCLGQVISYEDTVQLSYLQACVKEALRLYPPAPGPIPRIAPEGGITIGDRTFPEGVTLSVSPWVIQRSKDIWGLDADEFKPDRWLSVKGKSLEKYLIPFSVGYASCPGQHAAGILLPKILATIVRDYDIGFVDPEKEWTLNVGFLLIPSNWPVYIRKSL
ncbi:cytochrome P450 [Xylariales sp. PMI_506]|nr:cytochrome P450 [Xylariales sp. PMI_506]